MVRGQLGESVIGLAVDDGAFFNPAYFVLFRLYLDKSATALEHLKFLAVSDHRHAFTYCGNAIVEKHLPRGDVHRVMVFVLEALAPRSKSDENEQRKQAGKIQESDWGTEAFQSMSKGKWRSNEHGYGFCLEHTTMTRVELELS